MYAYNQMSFIPVFEEYNRDTLLGSGLNLPLHLKFFSPFGGELL